MSQEQWNNLLSIPPSLPDAGYTDNLMGLDNNNELPFLLESPTAASHDGPQTSLGTGSDGGEGISDTLSLMLQYSCPAIG
jgi:hypothetical protein